MKNDEKYTKPLIFVTLLFFIFGFLTCLNDILIPHLKGLFTLNFTQAMLIQVCFFSAYFFMSIPSGWITNLKGYRFGIVAGLAFAGIGTFGFLPAAYFASYPIFLFSLFVLASGITLLQVAVNPYVTLLGDPLKSSFRLNLVQAFNSLGTTIAPIIGSLLILNSSDKVKGIQIPYFILTVSLILIAFIFSKIPLPRLINFSNEDVPDENTGIQNYLRTLQEFPHVKRGMIAIFCYVGAEVAIGSFLVSWLSDTNVSYLEISEAGHFVAFYWGGAMVGRFIGSWLTAKFKPEKVLQISLVIIMILMLSALLFYQPQISMWAMIAIGLFNSIQFPVIFSLTVSDMGKETAYVSGLLCTSIVGGAIIPFIQGIIADAFNLRIAFVIPLLCYVYILLVSQKLKNQ
jgi:FHS family L-fucose permease-like MFS transporter